MTPNKFIIQLTTKYRIHMERLNFTLMERKTKTNAKAAIDEEVEDGYFALGYYPITKPELLIKKLIMDNIISNGGTIHLKLKEFVELFQDGIVKLSRKIGKVGTLANNLYDNIKELEEEITRLKTQNQVLKGKVTRLKKHEKKIHSRIRP